MGTTSSSVPTPHGGRANRGQQRAGARAQRDSLLRGLQGSEELEAGGWGLGVTAHCQASWSPEPEGFGEAGTLGPGRPQAGPGWGRVMAFPCPPLAPPSAERREM